MNRWYLQVDNGIQSLCVRSIKPFNLTTQYALIYHECVNIYIYNMLRQGLVFSTFSSTITWNGTNPKGQALSAGVSISNDI